MIIVNIKGGLGNQMLQFAFAKWLELKFNEEIKYDLRFFINQPIYIRPKKKRKMGLENAFSIHLKKASRIKLDAIVPKSIIGKIIKKTRILLLRRKLIYLSDAKLNVFLIEPNFDLLYADGYWGSIDYRKSLDLFSIFKFQSELNSLKKIVFAFKNKLLVSVHIRRGDYLDSKIFISVGKSYYWDAISMLNTGNTHFLFFTDDPEFIKSWEILNNIDFSIISGNGYKDYEELFIMTLCNHNIIANSTFSWWGAMLNKHTDKKVICPKLWYNDPDYYNIYPVLIPEEWIRL